MNDITLTLKANLVTRMSKKGVPYTALEVYITDNTTKMVFLNPAEVELLKIKDLNKK